MYMSMLTAMFEYLVISMLLDFLCRDIVFLVKLNDAHMESYEVSLNDANKRGSNRGVNVPSPYFLSQFLPPPYLLSQFLPPP